MNVNWIDETFDTLEVLYGLKSERMLANVAIEDALITRWEYRKMTGREAPYGVKGLVLMEFGEILRPNGCGGCGNCSGCCD